MKKILLLSALAGGIATGAQAQFQVANSDFEQWEDVNYDSYNGPEPLNWNSFLTGTGSLKGTAGRNQVEKSTEKRPGSTGNYSAKIVSRKVLFNIIAQGNLTTGCINMGSMSATDASGNYNYTNKDVVGQNMPFTGKPDAMKVWVKFVSSKNTNQAKVITILHTDGYYQDPVNEKRTEPTATLVATAEKMDVASKNEWQELVIPFVYKNTESPRYALISFATNKTAGKGTPNDYMLIDDLSYVYHSELSSFTLNGQAIDIPAAGATTDCSQLTYDEAQAAFTSNGQGATIEKAYDEASALLTVTVKGNDWSNENKNEHVYKFQFKKVAVAPATLTAVSIAGENFADFKSDTYTYTLPLVYNPGYVIKGTAAEGCTVKGKGDLAVGDNATKTFKLEVENSEQKVTTYTFNFTDAVAAAESGEYKGGLSVLLTALDDATTATPLANTTIALSKNSNNTYNLALNNFSFLGMPVGDIFVPNVALQNNKLEATRTIVMTSSTPGAMGNLLGALPVKVSVDLLNTTDKKAAASIDIILDGSSLAMSFKGIHVDFTAYTVDEKEPLTDGWSGPAYYPFIKAEGLVTKNTAKFLQLNNHYVAQDGVEHNLPMTYIDLTKADVADDVTLADIMAGAPQANNTLVYLPAGSKITGDNVIVDGQVASLKLTDAQPFNAPTAFTATTVNYDRAFSTEANYISSFVLPYSMNVSDVQGEVYEFASVEANTINFKKATTVEANKPYLIVATAANPFKATNVKVEATPAVMETVNGDYAHVGTYTKQEVISDATTTYYGYANGQFVKANTGTLNPFRTMIKATNTAAPTTLSLKLDGEVTGIVGVNSELGKVNVYNLEGKLVRSQVAAATALQGLAKGVYVINGKKVVK